MCTENTSCFRSRGTAAAHHRESKAFGATLVFFMLYEKQKGLHGQHNVWTTVNALARPTRKDHLFFHLLCAYRQPFFFCRWPQARKKAGHVSPCFFSHVVCAPTPCIILATTKNTRGERTGERDETRDLSQTAEAIRSLCRPKRVGNFFGVSRLPCELARVGSAEVSCAQGANGKTARVEKRPRRQWSRRLGPSMRRRGVAIPVGH